ncbi:MAG: hypothetical protein GY859_23740, partial [Desulfobacterales bacterium]|nr:hypothetical protein [Desulfobacterales bacterium]
KGEPLAVFHSDGDREKIEPAMEKFIAAYGIGDVRKEPPRLFYARVAKDKGEEWAR